jgi:hypothetical protein
MKRILSSVAALLLIPIALWSTACNKQAVAVALLNTAGSYVSQLATLEGNAALGAKLKTDFATAATQVQNWKSGTPAQDVVAVLNLVEDDLSLFPVIGPFAPLVDLTIGTVDAIITAVSANAPAPATTSPSVAAVRHTATRSAKDVKDFKSQWKALAESTPAAAIK